MQSWEDFSAVTSTVKVGYYWPVFFGRTGIHPQPPIHHIVQKNNGSRQDQCCQPPTTHCSSSLAVPAFHVVQGTNSWARPQAPGTMAIIIHHITVQTAVRNSVIWNCWVRHKTVYLVCSANKTQVVCLQKFLDNIPPKRIGDSSVTLPPSQDILQ